MSPGVLEFVQEGLGIAVLLALPFVAAALLGSVLTGMLQWISGLQDPAVATIVRSAAVVVALLVLSGAVATSLQAYVREAWTELAAIGRGESISR